MRTFITILIAAIVAGLVAGYMVNNKNGDTAGKKETAYERVIRTGTIRCGYGVGAPFISMDPNTKQMKGFAVDVMSAISKNLNLKIEWTEETGWGGMPEALNAGRVDVGCSSLWVSAPIAREAIFSDPFMFNGLYYWVRSDNDKFETLDDLKTHNAKFTFIEGDNAQEVITKRIFPQAEYLALPASTQGGEQILNVKTGKADAILLDPSEALLSNENTDIKLRALNPDRPVVTVPTAFPIGKNEVMLKNMIDIALHEMIANGELAQIMKPYQEIYTGAYYLPAQPYNQ